MGGPGGRWFSRRIYEAKYTAGTYADCALSVPIWAAEKIGRGAERVLGERTPGFLSVDKMRAESEVYAVREKLRDRLDTRPGALFMQSNIISTIPFFAVGMPAAEAAQAGIEHFIDGAPELVKCAANSLATLGAQMATAYTTFMVNEVRTNRHKFENDNGGLSEGKIWGGFKNAVKTFWKFDLTFIVAKLGLQTKYLLTGRDPWVASAKADSWGLPLWYTVAIPLGLKGRIIETRDADRVYGREEQVVERGDVSVAVDR